MSSEKSKTESESPLNGAREKIAKAMEENLPQDLDEVKRMAGALAEDAVDFVKKYPLPSLLGALALGFLIGSSMGRKKSE